MINTLIICDSCKTSDRWQIHIEEDGHAVQMVVTCASCSGWYAIQDIREFMKENALRIVDLGGEPN